MHHTHSLIFLYSFTHSLYVILLAAIFIRPTRIFTLSPQATAVTISSILSHRCMHAMIPILFSCSSHIQQTKKKRNIYAKQTVAQEKLHIPLSKGGKKTWLFNRSKEISILPYRNKQFGKRKTTTLNFLHFTDENKTTHLDISYNHEEMLQDGKVSVAFVWEWWCRQEPITEMEFAFW